MTELAVLVPVLSRPQNVAPLVASFLQGCPPDSRLLFIVTPDDTEEVEAVGSAITASQGENTSYVDNRVLWCWPTANEPQTWPHKINTGVHWFSSKEQQRITETWKTFPRIGKSFSPLSEPDWYLCAADDITFTKGWWDATADLRTDPTVGVIGTNDSATGSGNPRVLAGEHTCHPLIRASYIRDFGTIDQPGLAVHPGYAHWFVDDELVWTAKTRGAWAYCREAVIDHAHPYWDPTIPWDDTYARGEANAHADQLLWESRVHLIEAEEKRCRGV